jgi:hypothetical protein
MPLNYNDIQKTTKKATVAINKEEPLTEKELKRIQYYVEHMEDSIIEIAESGNSKLEYNCAKIPQRIFFEVAELFKKNNPLMLVITEKGTMQIVVHWSGKYEV